jgi:GDP/UDP-N,N'-diacetylbacillosamine 2-epimerase (hydrolysing)
MRIAVLTSSRADYGIYLPLLNRLKADVSIEFDLVVFGSHCSERFGSTVEQIKSDGFKPFVEIDNLREGDSPVDIAKSYSRTVDLFADFWNENSEYDWVLVLGDRFEMAAAVNAGVPFGIRFAHIHAGETTLGAIDNIYRHQISLASRLHFVSTEGYAKRVISILGADDSVEVVGALGLENVGTIPLLDVSEFQQKWNIDLTLPTVLMTIHPETVNTAENKSHIDQLKEAIQQIITSHQLVVTLPNADTMGSLYRDFFRELHFESPDKIFTIENFGTQSYFTCMKYASILIGNTSSGIIEAASFGKFVINLGNRQAGRETSQNVVSIPFESKQIISAFHRLKGNEYTGQNNYFRENSSKMIIDRLKRMN